MELAWGTQHFRLRFARAALTLRQVRADGDAKSVGVADYAELPVKTEGPAVLPADATLVAAQEVEFDELGIALPVLVFQAVHDAAGDASMAVKERSRGFKKRRRHRDSDAVCTLYFFLLHGRVDGEDKQCELQFVNRVDVPLPPSLSPALNSQNSGDAETLSVQLHITHGPHVVVSHLNAKELSIVKFRSEDTRFFVWRASVKLLNDVEDLDTADRVVSCEFVSEDGSDAPHLLMHFVHSTDLTTDAVAKCIFAWAPPHWSCAKYASCGGNHEKHAVRVRLWSAAAVVRPTDATNFQVHNGDGNQSIVFLGVQCNDVNRSFYLLSFDTSLDQPSMSIVHAFSHVGNALVGEFSQNCCADEILLINHVEQDEQNAASASTNDQLVVKKCVLICKKYGSEKYTIHRLRASQVEDKTNAPKARGSKRSRGTRNTEDATATPMRYIERIKFGSKERDNGNNESSGGGRASAAVSQSQLVQLTKSLEKRVANGIDELNRMKLVVAGKHNMVQRLNGFVMEQWWTAVQTLYSDIGRLPVKVSPAIQNDQNRDMEESSVKLETLVSATTSGDPHADEGSTLVPEYELESLVTLSEIHVVSFVPSSSVVRLEATLKNRSGNSMYNAYVAFVSRSGDKNSSVLTELHASSSVCAEFHCESDQRDGIATFLIDVVLPASIALLRTQWGFIASLWLHFSIQDHNEDSAKLAGLYRRNEVTTNDSAGASISLRNDCSLFVAPAAITLQEILHSQEQIVASRLKQPMISARETEELLVLSSGSSLLHIFHNSDANAGGEAHVQAVSAVINHKGFVSTIVRPTFALVDLVVAERDMANYYLSKILSSLPRDVYTMINPLRRHHLQQLQGLLHSIRMELVVLQRHSVGVPNRSSKANTAETGDDDDVEMSTDGNSSTKSSNAPHEPHEQWRLLTRFRQLQMGTDLGAVKLLHNIQKRANYHSAWYATP
ncbi:hypothetical protein FI667_g15705, partial [Globisporangium splendens]